LTTSSHSHNKRTTFLLHLRVAAVRYHGRQEHYKKTFRLCARVTQHMLNDMLQLRGVSVAAIKQIFHTRPGDLSISPVKLCEPLENLEGGRAGEGFNRWQRARTALAVPSVFPCCFLAGLILRAILSFSKHISSLVLFSLRGRPSLRCSGVH
jgi:hypothetical protein